jgi:hypothetical protein
MDALVLFGPDIWIADGPVLDIAGFGYPTRMAVMRLQSGGLVIWSPVALTVALRAAIQALGPVQHIIGPNRFHHLFIAEWSAAFPTAQVHAAPGLRKRRADLRFDHDLTDSPHDDWAEQIDQVILRGSLLTDEVIFFHRASRTAIFTDFLQQFPPDAFKGWRKWIATADLMIGPEPQVPRKFRLSVVRRGQARGAIATVLGWPVKQVIVAHGTPVQNGGHDLIVRAFRWLGVKGPLPPQGQ